MHLARHSITSKAPVQILDARFDADCQIFTALTPTGFAVYRSWPLELLRKRDLKGTLSAVQPLHVSSLLFLVGGGTSPLYPANKVILWDDNLGREVAELEFRERVCGIACRRGWLAVALRRRVVAFKVGAQVSRYQEWATCDNEKGLVTLATATHSTLLATAGRQIGHVQLIHLPPCPPPVLRSPPPPGRPPEAPLRLPGQPAPFIAAHTTALTSLAVVLSGHSLATTSARGTLIRIWDSHTGKLLRELRRGTDVANIYGVAFRPDGQEICVWSDKGTIHLFSVVPGPGTSNRQSTFSPLSPFLSLPKYFGSEWSYAHYRLPTQTSHISLSATSRSGALVEEERCVVGWIRGPVDLASPAEYQLIALTYSGGWYRLSIPSPMEPPTSPISRARTFSGSSVAGSVKGKEKETEVEGKKRNCTLREFRRFGRWDGWG